MGEIERTEPSGKIGIVFFIGGPDKTELYRRIQLFKALIQNIDLRAYGDLNEILIAFYLDGAVYSWDIEGVKGIRLEHQPGRLNGKVVVPEQVIYGDPDTSMEWLAQQLTDLFQAFATRLQKAKREFDTSAMLRDIEEAIHLMKLLPPLPTKPGGDDLMAHLRNYLQNRRVSQALGDPVPDMGWKKGYSMELDETSSDGIRFYSPSYRMGETE